MRKAEFMNLEDLRREIDRLDSQLIRLISRRMKLAERIGLFKKNGKKEVRDKKREEEIIKNVKNRANKSGLNGKIAVKIWKILISQSRKIQKNE